MSIILGIDPGTTTTGFAIINKNGRNLDLVDYGIIETTPKEDLGIKLIDIVGDLDLIIKKYRPTLVAIEKLFFTNNQKTGIDVAHSRGAILYFVSKKGLQTIEYTPLQIKRGICGNGSASKKQIQNAIKQILKLNSIPKPDDAADAIAIAYLASLTI